MRETGCASWCRPGRQTKDGHAIVNIVDNYRAGRDYAPAYGHMVTHDGADTDKCVGADRHSATDGAPGTDGGEV